jgi:hypothetical protein
VSQGQHSHPSKPHHSRRLQHLIHSRVLENVANFDQQFERVTELETRLARAREGVGSLEEELEGEASVPDLGICAQLSLNMRYIYRMVYDRRSFSSSLNTPTWQTDRMLPKLSHTHSLPCWRHKHPFSTSRS